MNIYVGNLPYGLSDQELREAFEVYGEVSSASVIMDKMTGRSRGFGFVEMPDKGQAEEAIKALNDKDVQGRPWKVNEAKPRQDRQDRQDRPRRY
ncbi:MAG: RNA-binding protein [Deltaproteobacteria bacterium]|nr:RNA-binding protein [Deltaproteobacteria bacterium]